MANTKAFVQHVLDLFAPIADVTARAMFGGHGLYVDGVMFGLLDDDELFLRADDETRAHFEKAHCKQWIYGGRDKPMKTDYWAPPPVALESSDDLRPWAERAFAAAHRKAASKAKKKIRGHHT